MDGDDDNLDGDRNLSLKRILKSCSLSLSCAILSGAPPFQIEMVSDILSFSCFLFSLQSFKPLLKTPL